MLDVTYQQLTSDSLPEDRVTDYGIVIPRFMIRNLICYE
ncbi:hypothetical protein [Klebsiella phage GADU21]|nr:hypothetical protein [Klebsiella phage GADU21]